jgi:phospholipid-binding lipoprotein MlaA
MKRIDTWKSLIAVSMLAFSAPAYALDANWTSGAQSSAATDNAEAQGPCDPWEGVNRDIMGFNIGFDRYVFKPVVTGYRVVPAPVRKNVNNFLTNLGEPLNVVHGILQLNGKAALTSLWRFILNTTLGLGGIRDFAGENGLHYIDQNLGKTMGRWGVPAGPYVVLPILGPSSVRDTTGKVGDWFLDPVGWELNTWESVSQGVANGIDARDVNSGIIENLYYQSLDPYVATRSVYRQHEAFEANKKVE